MTNSDTIDPQHKFTNRSLTYTFSTLLLWLSILIATIFVGWVSFTTIFVGRIYENIDTNSLILLAVEFVLLLGGIYLCILLPYKNIIYDSYLVLGNKHLTLKYVDFRFGPQFFKFKWTEIEEISEQVGAKEYEFMIITKTQHIRLPLEIYQNTLRTTQLKSALLMYKVPTRYSKIAQAILLFTDILIGLVLTFVVGVLFLSVLRSVFN